MSRAKRIVILGGGYAGLSVAAGLRDVPDTEVWLYDRNPAFTDPLRLHEIICEPVSALRESYQTISRRMGFRFPDSPPEECDYLVVATGSPEKHPPVDLPDPLTVSRWLAADDMFVFDSWRQGRPLLVAGAGPTGVQIASHAGGEVHLTDLSDIPLSGISAQAGRECIKQLRSLSNFHFHSGGIMTSGNKSVILADGTRLQDPAVFLATGKDPAGIHCDRHGRANSSPVSVRADVTFAAGDNSLYPSGDNSQTAQAAVRKGYLVASVIKAMLAGLPLPDYAHSNLGTFIAVQGGGLAVIPSPLGEVVLAGAAAGFAKSAIERITRAMYLGF